MPRKKQKLVSTLTPTEWKAVFAMCDKRTPTGTRDLAFYLMSYRTGMRLSELQYLRYRDVDLKTGDVTVPQEGKSGGRILGMPLTSPSFRDAQEAWLDVRNRVWKVDSDYYFTTRTGGMLEQGGVRHTLAHRAEKAGIDYVRVSPHMLRHSFATEMLSEGASIRDLMDMLGHSSIDVTRVYLHSVKGRAQKLMRDRIIPD